MFLQEQHKDNSKILSKSSGFIISPLFDSDFLSCPDVGAGDAVEPLEFSHCGAVAACYGAEGVALSHGDGAFA